MKELITTFCIVFLLLIISFSILENKMDKEDEETNNYLDVAIVYEQMFRMGPILLKFDKEWILEENGKKYLRIGFRKGEYHTKELDKEYDNISPKSMASSTYESTIVTESSHRKKDYDIVVYNIECDKTKMWIDLNGVITTRYNSRKSKIVLELIFSKDVFFYNPTTKKWWGKPYYNEQDVRILMFSDLFKESNTAEDFKKLFKREIVKAKEFVPNVINKRTLILPCTKYYEEKIRVLQIACIWYDMYIEKEKIKPKNNDDE